MHFVHPGRQEENRIIKTCCRATTTNTQCIFSVVLPWLFPLTSCEALALPSKPLLLLHQHRTAVHDWPLLDGCVACLSLQLADPRGPAVQQGAPQGLTVSPHLLDSGSCPVYGCHQCEADGLGSPSVMSNLQTKWYILVYIQ